MIELLKSGRVDNSILCELATQPDFLRLMADLEIYVTQQDINKITLDLRETHKDDFFSVPEDTH